jgi:hypothetical protein
MRWRCSVRRLLQLPRHRLCSLLVQSMMVMRTLVKRISGTAGYSVSFLRAFSSVAGGRVGMSILGPGAVQPAGSKRTDALAIHHAGYPIEGYCVMCDQFWALSSRERLQLAKILGS